MLLAFCSEGDNMPDAVNLFLYVNNWLKLVPRKEVSKDKNVKHYYPVIITVL